MEKIQDNTGKLYNSLKANGFNDIGTEEVFRGKLKEEGARKELHDALSKNGFNDIGNFDVFNSKIGEDYIKGSGEEKGFWDSYTGDLVERVGAGAARLQGGGLNLLEKASRYYNPTASISKGQPNKFQQFLMKDVIAPIFYDEAERNKLEASPVMNYNHVPTAGKELKSYADTLSSRSDRYEGKDFMELWKDNKTSAIGELFLTASESLPQGVMAAAGGAVSLPVIGAIAASDKYDKLSQDEATGDMSESAKLINSVLTGTGEAISEVGSVYIGKWLKPLYGKLGKQAAEEVAKNGFSRWMSGMFKKSGVFFAPVEEGIEEMASQLAENATDYITGATKELNLWDGVPESFAYGAAGGAQFSAAALPGLARRKIQRRGVNSEYRKSKSALESAFPDSDVTAFENGMSTMNPEEQVEILQGIVKNPDIQDEQKAVVADFVSKMNKRQLYNSPEAKAEDKVYGMFDGKVNKKSGDIVTAKDLDEKPVYVLDETDKGSLVEYENGEKKLIATSALQDINSEPVDEHVKKHLLNTFTQGNANVKANMPRIDVGVDVLYGGSKARVQRLEDGMATIEVDGTDGVRVEKVPVSKLEQAQKPEDIQADDDGLTDVKKDVEKATEQPQTPISYEIEKDIIATQQPDGAFSINKEFTKADIEKGQKFVDRMNKDYEDEGMFFELAELPKVNSDNRFEKKRFGVVARERVQESPEQAQKPEDIQADDDGLTDVKKDVEKATEQPQTPISYEIEKDIIATQQPDGAFSINKEFTKADIEKGQKFVDRMNKDYEDEGMFFELAELPKVNSDNRFEKKRFGVVARERVQESPEQAQKPEEVQVQEPEEMQPEFSNEEEAVNWVADNSEDVGEILGTLNAVRQVKNPQANLQEWQRHLIGSKVKVSSYNQFGDRNNVTPTMRMKWFSKDGLPLDVIARDLSQYEREVTEQDVVDFITSNPTNRVSNSTEEIERLERRFSEVATKASGMKIGRPGSPTGKLFIENVKNRESSEQLRQRIEDAQRAESEVLQSIAEQHEVEEREQEDVQPIGHGLFGNIYDQFKGKAKEAIRFLGNKKEGEAIGALHHPQVGDIDLVWGKEGSAQSDGFGLSKIARYHPEVLDNLQDIISDMVVVKASPNRISLESNTHKASVRLEWDGEKKTWLLTAFEKETPTSIDRTTDIGENLTDLQNDTAPLQNVSVSSIDKDIEITGENQGIDEDDVFDNAESTMVNETYSDTGEIDEDGVRFREINNEIEDIKNKTIAAGIFMKAPNGKPTNLTEKQWIQVRTKAFKKWFGDWEGRPKTASKVVDVNGEPLVVYHGSSKSFTEFNQRYMGANGTAIGQGFYFTSDKSFADGYSSDDGNVFEVFLNLRKELDSKNITIKKAKLKSILKEIDKVSSDEVAHSFLSNYNDVEYNGLERTLNEAVEMEMDAADSDVELIGGLVNGSGSLRGVYEVLEKTTGHDGILEKQKDGSVHFVVGRPNQIKSATDNTGSFSKDSDDIRYREGSPENVNERFNRELDSLTEESANGKVFHLGMPSKSLLSVGIPNKPFRLYGNKLLKKAKKHGFTPTDIKNLPHALENPIAVFNGNHRSSYAILTELEIRNNKVLVSVETNKDGEIDFNLVSSVFGKSSRSIVNWINSDKLRFSDKEKTLSYLSASALNADATNNSELSSATNIAQNFVNPTLLEGEISSAIDTLSDELGVKVNKVKDRKDLPEGIQRKMLGTRYPGLYDTKTGKVYVVLNEITDVGDAQATVLHEVLGHKGIRGLFGDKLSDFTDRVLMSMKDTDREKLINDYDGNQQLAAEEYIASFAEGYTDPSGWEKVKAIVKEFFREMGISLDISDNDLKYILWKAKNGLREGDGMMNVLEKTTRDNHIQDVLFRKPSPLQTAEEFIQEKQNFLAKAKERFLDSTISVKKLSDYLKKQGVNVHDFEDAYTEALLSDSKSFHAMNRYREKYQQPLNEAVAALNKKGKSFLDIYHYLIAKHASERNREMGKREYGKWLDSKHREALIEKQKYDFFKKNGKKNDAEYAKKLKSFEENIARNEQKFKEERKEKQALFQQEVYAGMTDPEAADIVKTFETDCTKDEINGLWQKINAATKFALERQRIDGLISKELFNKLNGMYEYYVPLKGWEESDGVDYSTSERFHRPSNVSKLMEAKGRKSRADNPLAYIEMAAERAIVEGNRNYVRQCLYNMCVNNPNKKLYTVNRTYYVNRDGEWIAQTERPDKEMFESGMAKTVLIDKPYKAAVSDANAQRYDVNVLVNGEKCTITFAQGERGLDIADAINRARMVSLDDKVSKWVGRFTRFLSAQNTSRNPEFILRNFERDFLYAVPAYAIKGGNSIKLMANMRPAFKALHNEFMKGGKKEDTELNRYMDEFLNSGGKTGFVHSLDIESRKRKTERDIRRIRNKKSIGGAARATGHAIGATMEYLSDMSENSIRFAVFLTERQAGRNVKEAAIAAKEITVNFNRKGTLTPAMSQYYSFFNASMQGSLHNFLGLGIKWTNRFLAANAALGGIQMIAAQLSKAFGDDDEMGVSDYDRLSDFTRNNNIILPDILRLGKYFGTDNEEARQYGFMTIPMPQSFRAFSAVGIITDQVLCGRKSASDGALEIVDNILANMSPLDLETYTLSEGQPGIFVARALPTVLQPFVDIVANKNFMDRKIYNEPYSKNLEGMVPQSSLGLKNTNPLFVSASKLLNKIANGTTNINPEIQIDSDTGKVSRNKLMGYMDVNPAQVEHIVEGIAGGAGKFGNNMLKTINSFITQEELDNRNIPFVRTHRTMPYRQTHWEMYFAAREMVDDVNFAASAFKKIKNFDMHLRILMNGDQLRDGISFTVIETLVNDCDRVLMDLSTTEEGKKEWQKITDKRVLEWAKGQKQMYDEAIKKEDDKKKRIK